MPLALLILGALLALVVALPSEAYRLVRTGIIRVAPFALVLALVMLAFSLFIGLMIDLAAYFISSPKVRVASTLLFAFILKLSDLHIFTGFISKIAVADR